MRPSWRILALYFFLNSISVKADQINVWPLPQQVTMGQSWGTVVGNNFDFKCTGSSCSSVLTQAFDRYKKHIFFAGNGQQGPSPISLVHVNAASVPALKLHVDESYKIDVTTNGASITANTEWGALRGLETFSQLVRWNYTTDTYVIDSLPISISDLPRFPWRGLMIDTARHYLPLNTIMEALEAMSYHKFNVLHWHIVDSQSFPLESKVYPRLSQMGSWVPQAVYSQADVMKVIEYARIRGIRVVPEFDTPGHAYPSWYNGYPELFANCPGNDKVMDPTKNSTLNFMKNFLTEMSSIFPDQFFHLGGDEVSYNCWKSVPEITKWMQENHVENYADLQGYYEMKVQQSLTGVQRTAVFWDEVLSQSEFPLLPDSVVEVWNQDQSQVVKVVKLGYNALYASPWYLDRQVPDPDTFYLWVDTWKDFYRADPVADANLTPNELQRVFGGEVCMWGEQVDEYAFNIRVWPRAGAVAERLWSAKDVTDEDGAETRLMTMRCRQVQRGIASSPIRPDWCPTGK